MPDGLADRSKSDPRNFTLEQWQQAKRNDRDPREIKAALSDAWSISDSRTAFAHALKERGYWLAKGDRRGFTALDIHGEVYSIPRWAGVKTKAVRERLGDEHDLPSVNETREIIASGMDTTLTRLQSEQEAERRRVADEHARQKQELVEKQRTERAAQARQVQERQDREQRERQARFRRGLAGIWDRLRGEHRRLTQQNTLEAQRTAVRDREERDRLIFAQLEARKAITLEATKKRLDAERQGEALRKDRERYAEMAAQREAIRKEHRKAAEANRSRKSRPRAPPSKTADSLSARFSEGTEARDQRKARFKARRERLRQESRNRNRPDFER